MDKSIYWLHGSVEVWRLCSLLSVRLAIGTCMIVKAMIAFLNLYQVSEAMIASDNFHLDGCL